MFEVNGRELPEWIPRPDQEAVLEFGLGRKRWICCAPTGAGKTAMAAAWLNDLLFDQFVGHRVLIVAPPIVARLGWLGEFGKWKQFQDLAAQARYIPGDLFDRTPEAEIVVGKKPDGTDKVKFFKWCDMEQANFDYDEPKRGALVLVDRMETRRILLDQPGRVHTVSWDHFQPLVEALGQEFPYDVVIFDESSFLKDQEAERSKAARFVMLKLPKVKWALLLTATPNVNHTDHIWHQAHLVAEGLMGDTLTKFRESYLLPDKVSRQTGQVFSWKAHPGMVADYEAKLKTIMVSVPDVLDVELLEVLHPTEMPAEAWAAYRAMENTGVFEDVLAPNKAVERSKLQQIAQGCLYDGKTRHSLHTARLDALCEFLENLESPALVIYGFDEVQTEVARRLGKQFADIREPRALAGFKLGKIRWLGLHPASGGHGVDGLQKVAHHVVWVGPIDDKEADLQVNGRLRRTGTTQPTVFVHRFYTPGTVEQRIIEEVLPARGARHQILMNAISAV